MKRSRRSFIGATLGTAALGAAVNRAIAKEDSTVTDGQLARIRDEPVLNLEGFKAPLTIESMRLFRNGKNFLVRVRTTDGAEGISVPNAMRLIHVYPLFVNCVAPFFVGKDARQIEPLLWELYRWRDNYKFQGLSFWVCVAAAEIAILDCLGRVAKRPIGDLLGGVRRRNIPVYRASGNRGNRPEDEVEYLQQLVAETGARALKFRVGGRMSKNADSLPGRTEKLIPMVRKAFGNGMTLYADSNSSYDVPHAIRVGLLMQRHNYAFFEEPCEFDHLEETKQVADALTMPVAGGEQEFSMRRFRWTIHNRAVDVVQPDLHYFGGFIRSMRVARMAHAAGLKCTPHMSGSGLGYVDMLHFVSCIPNPSEFHEFKGNSDIPFTCETSSLRCKKGMIDVPAGPGIGLSLAEDWVRKAKPVTAI